MKLEHYKAVHKAVKAVKHEAHNKVMGVGVKKTSKASHVAKGIHAPAPRRDAKATVMGKKAGAKHPDTKATMNGKGKKVVSAKMTQMGTPVSRAMLGIKSFGSLLKKGK